VRLQDVMSTDVKTVGPDVPAEAAWTTMAGHGIHHLVVMKDGAVAGVLSDRDAGGRDGAELRRHCAAGDLMSEPAIVATPSTTVRKAANLMRGRSIGCLVVVEKGRLRGIVTVSDLLGLIGRGTERPQRPPLSHRVPHQKHRRTTAAW
jgi:acetoin utilization protein AcuB